MKFYHATTEENMEKILEDGCIKHSVGNVVYLCKKPLDTCKFLVIRGIREMCVIEVNIKENQVEESLDHSEAFFRCKAYTHNGDIKLSGAEDVRTYRFDL